MPPNSLQARVVALKVIQQAALLLANWASPVFSPPYKQAEEDTAVASQFPEGVIARSKELLNWGKEEIAPLKLVFDCIQLGKKPYPQHHYRPAWALELLSGEEFPRIPYAQNQPPSPADFEKLKKGIRAELNHLQWENLAQLTMFLEKFGSHVSLGGSDVALIDLARSTTALAVALAQQPDEQLALIGGDLMGVQNFIYTIASEGALKSLRARSFYLELATEEVVQQVLEALDLPRTNVVYAGASKFYILAAATDQLKVQEAIQTKFNEWLRKKFQRKVFLAIAHHAFPAAQLKTDLAQVWLCVNNELNAQATRKFAQSLDALLEPQTSHQPCKVCHRDDVPEEQLKRLNDFEEDSVLVCDTCKRMSRLGSKLPRVKALVRSQQVSDLENDIQVESSYYRVVPSNYSPGPGEIILQINNWDLNAYSHPQVVPLLLGNYFKPSEREDEESHQTGGFMTAAELADTSSGIKRVGYLRMDVDRLSQIFSKGLGTDYTLPRLSSLSRQMTYLFKVYLNSLAKYREENFLDLKRANGEPEFELLLPASKRQNLLFIYAGGDDLFISGAWNEVTEFAFDVYQAFRAFTGHHPEITLSGGISIEGQKFPLYQAAQAAGDAEDAAKDNGRDSLSLFGQVLKWQEWLGQSLDEQSSSYLKQEAMPDLIGVLPFVNKLLAPHENKVAYPQSFIRNLLITAQLREQKIQEAQKHNPTQEQDVTYYLHLPKLAYALSRLPRQIKEQEEFKPIRQSLMNPRNSPYFRAIATWIELLNRQPNTDDSEKSRP